MKLSMVRRALYVLAAVLLGTLYSLPPASASGNNNPEVLASETNSLQITTAPQISGDGRYVAYQTVVDGDQYRIAIKDRQTGAINNVQTASSGEGVDSFYLSKDAKYIAYTTYATGIDPRADGRNAYGYRMSVATKVSQLVTIDSDGTPYPVSKLAISDDGSKVLWNKSLDNTGQNFSACFRNIAAATTSCPVNRSPVLSFGSGRYIFSQEGSSDYYRYDITTGQEIPFNMNGSLTLPAVFSSDGHYGVNYAYDNDLNAYGLVKVNVDTNEATTRIFSGDGTIEGHMPAQGGRFENLSLSANGNVAAFTVYLGGVMYFSTGNETPQVATYNFNTDKVSTLSRNRWANYSDYGAATADAAALTNDGLLAVFGSSATNLGDNAGSYANRIYINGTDGTTSGQTDTIKPVAGLITPQQSTKDINDTETFSVPVSDDNSGVTQAEFYLTDNNQGSPSFARPSAVTKSAATKSALTAPAAPSTAIKFPGQYFYGTLTKMTIANGVATGIIGSDVPDSDYTITVHVQDTAGNWSDDSSTAQLSVTGLRSDDTPPVVTGTTDPAPNAASWNNTAVTINWTSTDPEPSAGEPTQPDPTTASNQGKNTYTSDQSCDPAGNCATGSLDVWIDSVLPGGTFTGSDKIKRKQDDRVTGTSTDTTSGVTRVDIVGLNGNTLSSDAGQVTISCNTARTSCTWSADATSLAKGHQTLTLKVTDTAGNVYATTKSYNIS
ncbi:MAG: domain protein beta Propeller [Candidatus Saccharibacteria bacterium]|nr:domain protein beta Propeller [Candidatus Saccharibacteria bacterium]